MKMMLSEIANAVGATFNDEKYKDVTVTSVEFDSRHIQPEALFVPLMGQRDGHDFVQSAIDGGAVATFWQKGHDDPPAKFPVLEVADTLKALQELAKYFLNKVNPKVIAVTGSNGKTTTKDMITAVLSSQFNVHKTEGNFNNEIGVPITILRMKMSTEVLVVEMGMDRPGQLDYLSALVEPDIAVITMIGEAHIEYFGTRQKIAEAKMEITNHLKEDGLFIYNGDEPLLQTLAKALKQDQKTFGFETTNDVFATAISSHKHHASFMINTDAQKYSIPMIGKYNVCNALAAILVAQHYRLSPERIAKSLKNFVPTKNRAQWRIGDVGEDILDDVYNSNPTAAIAVLKSFGNIQRKVGGRRIAVLADMLELGDESARLHRRLATVLTPDVIDEVYLYGTEIKALADALSTIYAPENLHYYQLDSQQKMINDLKEDIHQQDLVLLKGSHGMKLDVVLQALL